MDTGLIQETFTPVLHSTIQEVVDDPEQLQTRLAIKAAHDVRVTFPCSQESLARNSFAGSMRYALDRYSFFAGRYTLKESLPDELTAPEFYNDDVFRQRLTQAIEDMSDTGDSYIPAFGLLMLRKNVELEVRSDELRGFVISAFHNYYLERDKHLSSDPW